VAIRLGVYGSTPGGACGKIGTAHFLQTFLEITIWLEGAGKDWPPKPENLFRIKTSFKCEN